MMGYGGHAIAGAVLGGLHGGATADARYGETMMGGMMRGAMGGAVLGSGAKFGRGALGTYKKARAAENLVRALPGGSAIGKTPVLSGMAMAGAHEAGLIGNTLTKSFNGWDGLGKVFNSAK